MLTPFDDYPIHQTPLPVAQVASGHPDHYDRYWFNGYTEDTYFAVALGVYPNRGVIDAAFSVVHEGVQRSVFATGRVPLDRTETRIGPISIEIVEPLRVNRVRVDAEEHGLVADLTYRARTAAYEEARQTLHSHTTLMMDVTRATQLGSWTGSVRSGGTSVAMDRTVHGTKDRSWGIRPIGQPAPAAPSPRDHQVFFLYSPLNFEDRCLHYMVFEDSTGARWAESAAVLPVIGDHDPVFGPDLGVSHVRVDHQVRWAPGLRRSEGATLLVAGGDGPGDGLEAIELEPLLTFRQKGVGYQHPEWKHGTWRGELLVGAEEAAVEDLDDLAPENIHVQQVVRATWGERQGLGVLEQLVIGPHAPSGFTSVLDGDPA
ncbi:hypothetical protein [Nocardioides sp. zg-DK7169]|uniref:hypothetical protein n=1 Tax=Nocardioides sp. zg-DK7169 TaxID=2736600 RepID=UPI001557AB5F|nr:hypothetical protein [Nocardioides sp. zg-DK7169]NPC96678.1 hypothetical protein [Nocardioides sp. zg-DK7169]